MRCLRLLVSCGLAALLATPLLFADLRPTGPPGLVFEQRRVHLGRIERGDARTVRVRWRRIGGGTLTLLGLRADCGCAVAGGLPDEIAEGASGVLEVRLRERSRRGPFRFRVRAVADTTPLLAVRDVHIDGHVEARIAFLPSRLDLGPRTPGTEVVREIEVVSERPLPADARVRWSGAEGSATVLPRAVRLAFVVPAASGRRVATLELFAGDLGRATLPVAFEVRGDAR